MHNRYRYRSLRENRYLALVMEAIVCFAWFTGNLAPLLAIVYIIILAVWFIFG